MYRRMFFGMLTLGTIAALLILVPVLCFGQERAHGYLFTSAGDSFGSGGSAGALHFGGGAEIFAVRGLAISPELGYLAPWKSLGDGIGVLSANGTYHFLRKGKTMPFITGGYSLGFRNGTMNMANFGAGFDRWIGERHGLRLEVRDHYAPSVDQHYLGVRVAWTFR